MKRFSKIFSLILVLLFTFTALVSEGVTAADNSVDYRSDNIWEPVPIVS